MSTFEEHRDATLDAATMHQMLVDFRTLTEFLGELARAVAATTGHHVGITTRHRNGGPFTAAMSHDDVLQLDELQYADGDGPCLQAMRDHAVVRVDDMADERRWAPYPEQAAALGVTSILSYPLVGRDRVAGALNLYSFDADDVAADHLSEVGALAGPTTNALELALRFSEQGDVIANLQTALTSRSTIDQAIGVLMAQQRCTARAAFDLLTTASQGRNVKLRDIAAEIVNRIGAG